MTDNEIGTLNEKPLHAALKAYCARPGDRLEVPVDGYVIDIVRGDLLIEIQTANFAAIKAKLYELVPRHPLRLVYPIAAEKWIVKRATAVAPASAPAERRKSPKRGVAHDIFTELVRFPELLAHPNFTLHLLLIHEEEARRHVPGRRWRRRGWATEERRLLDVVDEFLLESPAGAAALLPAGLPDPFTTEDLARALGRPRWLAQKMAYCLREMGPLVSVGKRGRSVLYSRA